MPRCENCKSARTEFFHKIKKYFYYRCNNCQTLFLHHKPRQNQLNDYYKKNFEYKAGEINEVRIRSRARIIIKNLNKLNPYGKSLLDIGSGFGFFLNEAQKFGLKTTAIEPSKYLTAVSMYRYIDTVYNLTFDKYFSHYKNRKFDFIAIIHTIEHITNPHETVYKALKLLNPNGILCIETPNLDSHLFYAERYNYTFLTPPDHIWLFSQRSFHFILKKIPGIEIKKISTYSYPEHFMGVVKRIVRKTITTSHPELDSGSDSKKQIPKQVRNDKKTIKHLKFRLFDQLIAPFLTPLLNLGIKGSILELYIKKK